MRTFAMHNGTHFLYLGRVRHVSGNVRIRRPVFRYQRAVLPRCHAPSSVQPSLLLQSLRFLIHPEELRCLASDVTVKKIHDGILRTVFFISGANFDCLKAIERSVQEDTSFEYDNMLYNESVGNANSRTHFLMASVRLRFLLSLGRCVAEALAEELVIWMTGRGALGAETLLAIPVWLPVPEVAVNGTDVVAEAVVVTGVAVAAAEEVATAIGYMPMF